jgi:hypothetical protein
MAANFPGTPTIGDTVTIENVTYRWNGTTWTIVSGRIVTAVVQSNNGTIDLSKGNYHKIAIDSGNATVTVSFTNVSSGSSKWFLELNVSASYTITWPASVIWEADTAPATTGSQTLILKFYTSDSGTNIYGVESINKDNTPPYSFQGSVSGYTSGGLGPTIFNIIDKFPFASDANATDVGDLTQLRRSLAGQSSSTSGYASGGWSPIGNTNTVDKFPFAADANASDVGDLTQARQQVVGQSSSESGYTSGGYYPGELGGVVANTIDKFPFATDGNATDVGDLTQARRSASGQSSSTSGYTSGGIAPPTVNTINKFPFATDGNATDVGDLTQGRYLSGGQSSDSNGYVSGGMYTFVNTIDKFPFATDANASDVGNITQARAVGAGQSSTASGYTSGGITSPYPTLVNIIDKFPFASDANATDVGDLTVGRYSSAGQQV